MTGAVPSCGGSLSAVRPGLRLRSSPSGLDAGRGEQGFFDLVGCLGEDYGSDRDLAELVGSSAGGSC